MVRAVTPIPFVKARFFDRCGKPLTGGQVYTYEANTTTPKVTYKDPYGLTPNTNPIILDAAGEADIYLDGTYRIRITDRNDVLVNDVAKIGSWFSDNLQDTLDNISGAMDAALKPMLQNLDDAINTAAAAGAGANGWDDMLIAVSENINQRQINDGLESVSQLASIKNPRSGMRVDVKSYNAPNYALIKPFDGGGGTFIYDSTKANINDGGLTINGWVRQDYTAYKPEFWGADPHNQTDCADAFNKCFDAAKGKTIELDGHYKFLSPIVVDYAGNHGLKIIGQGTTMMSGQNTTQKTVLNFDALPTNSRCLTLKNIRSLHISDFHVSHATSFNDASVSVWITTLHHFSISNITIKNTNGSESIGIKFGETDGHDCAFMGTVSNCEFNMLGGKATSIQNGCTSINHINCYQQGGYFYILNSEYCKYDNCASEGSLHFGYVTENCRSITYTSCAGEANDIGVFTVKRGSSNIEYISPYGAANKGVYGVLLFLDGRNGYNANIKISNPISKVNPNARADIYAEGQCGTVIVDNIYAPSLPNNIGGSYKFIQNNLITRGDIVFDNTFAPTSTTFNASTQPKLLGGFSRNGNIVELDIIVKPIVYTKTTDSTTIQIPTFGGIRADTVGNVVGVSSNKSYGACLVDSNGSIRMPVIDTAFAERLLIKATLQTNHTIE